MPKAPTDRMIPTSSQPPVSLAAMIRKEGGNEEDSEVESEDRQTSVAMTVSNDQVGRPGGMKLAVAADDDDEEIADPDQESDPDAEDDDDLDDVAEAVLSVPKAQCLQCSHLVAFAEKSYKSCHYSAGNEACPAKTVTIVMAVPMTIVHNFLRAEKEGDTAKLSRLYETLGKKSAGIQRQVLDAIQEAREKAKAK